MKYIILFFIISNCFFVQNELVNIFNYCQTTINLEDFGPNSSIKFSLTQSKNLDNICNINLEVSNTHLLYIRLVNNNTENFDIENNNFDFEIDQLTQKNDDDTKLFEKYLEKVFNSKKKSPNLNFNTSNCTLNIYQPDLSKIPIFQTNPCSSELNQDGTLLGNKATLQFMPQNGSTQKWVLITAIGTGDYCFNPQMFSCWQQGWTPLLCISRDFLCDGVVHCPTNGISGDENIEICKDRNIGRTNWEKMANDFLKKFTSKNKGLDTLLPAIQKGEKRWLEYSQTTQHPQMVQPNATLTDPSPNMVHFGPWSYLMLGMLICGTILTFCGIWECCCHKNKLPTTNHLSESPSVTSAPANSSAVLVMTSQPPKYDELDQPPSYKILFPEKTI